MRAVVLQAFAVALVTTAAPARAPSVPLDLQLHLSASPSLAGQPLYLLVMLRNTGRATVLGPGRFGNCAHLDVALRPDLEAYWPYFVLEVAQILPLWVPYSRAYEAGRER